MVSVRRRSRRTRRPAHSVYDDAKEALLEEEEGASSPASSKGSSKKANKRSSTSSSAKQKKPQKKKKQQPKPKQRKKKKKEEEEEEEEVEPPPSPAETEDDDEHMEKKDSTEDKEEEEEEEDAEMGEEQEEEEPESSSSSSSSEDDDDSDDEYKAPSTAAAARKKKKPSPKAKAKKSTTTTASARAVTPATGQKKKKKTTTAAAAAGPRKSRRATATATSKSIKAALKGIAKNVLHDEEKPDNSLFANLVCLLQEGAGVGAAGAPSNNNNNQTTKKRTRVGGTKKQQQHANNEDENTNAQLDGICRRVLKDYDADPNKAQVDLFNLLFRSVGTTYENTIDSQEIDLEVASDDDWEEIITRVTEGMQHTVAERVLLAANPDGALAEQNANTSGSNTGKKSKAKNSKALVAPLHYRALYMNFWYRLGMVAMSASNQSIRNKKKKNDSDSSDEDEEEDSESPTTTGAGGSSRFQVEMAREIISRLIEVSGVGQPDIRAAASLAVYQFTQALLDHSADLWGKVQVATRQLNAATKNKSSRGGRKAEMLQNQIDSHDRIIKEIEEIVITSVIGSVFTKRYKDSNKHIRSETMNAVSRFTISRPDLLLKSTYLKYFGWMLSDKEAVVRESALRGFLVPFREAEEMSNKTKKGPRIDKRTMQHAIDNFIHRIADCVIDTDLAVQERAMELLLVLLQEDCLDRLDDDAVWQQINMRALEPNTTPQVRCGALRVVTEQLEAFDDAVAGGTLSETKAVKRIDGLCKWLAHALSDGTIPLDEIKYDRVDYVIHSLRALGEDEGHYKALVTNWSAILRALENDDQVSHSESTNRSAAVRQRVMLRYLVCSAELEVSAAAAATGGGDEEEDPTLMDVNMDPDLLHVSAANLHTLDPTGESKSGRGKKRKTASKESPQEKLTQALLTELPDLLVTFRVETSVLRDLTTLPLYFDPTVLSLQNRKRDFMKLLSRISDVFVESTDTKVLQNCARVLTSMAELKNHARTGEALLQLKKTTCSLRDRLLKLLEEKANLPSLPSKDNKDDDGDDDAEDNTSSARDLEVSISLCLRRLVEISRKWDIADLLGKSGGAGGDTGSDCDDEPDDDNDQELNTLCIAIAAHIARELKAREVTFPDTADDSDDESKEAPQIPDIWSKGDQDLHKYVAETVMEGLNLLLSVTAWRLNKEIDLIVSKEDEDDDGTKEDNDDDDDDNPANHIVVQMRDRVLKLLNYCFSQHLYPSDYDDEDEMYSPEHLTFSRALGEHSCKVAGDLRVLFPKSFSDADSSLLRACALLDNDDSLLGGFQCVLASNCPKLRENEKEEKDPNLAIKILLPMARGLATSWKKGHRREAGSVLSHITGSGRVAHEIVTSTARVMKKIDPIRVLESHMACLQSDFMAWMEAEPEDLGDRPTAEDLEAFEREEQEHIEKFEALEHLASRLSASLGVGKLSPNLSPALLGFVGEGVRFAFNTSLEDMEGESVGARLPFLRVIGKYLSWVRRSKAPVNALRQQFNTKELELREHPEFEELDEFDLETLEQFRKDGGFGPLPARKQAQHDDDDGSHAGASSAARSTGRRQPRMSGASFTTSSSIQTKSTLSPLPEEGLGGETEDDDDDDDESPSSKRQKIEESARSQRSAMSQSQGSSTANPSTRSIMSRSVATNLTQTTIEEGNDESDDENESPASSKRSTAASYALSSRSVMSHSVATNQTSKATMEEDDDDEASE